MNLAVHAAHHIDADAAWESSFAGRQLSVDPKSQLHHRSQDRRGVLPDQPLVWPDYAADVASGRLWMRGLSGQECPLHMTCIQHIQILQAAAGVEQDYRVFGLEESAGPQFAI